MALPALNPPNELSQFIASRRPPRDVSELIASLESLAINIERAGANLIRWWVGVREAIQSDVLDNGSSAETAQYIIAALQIMQAEAAMIEGEIFDAQAANRAMRPFAGQISSGQRRAVRKSAVRVESSQKDVISRLRQNADALFAFYDSYITKGPPDPWPPEDRND